MAFDWAQRMRTIVVLLVVAVLVIVIGATIFAFTYKVPSCSDRVQNQDESGVDCGGSCQYLCTAEVRKPTLNLERVISLANGRTDVIAKVQNVNKSAQAKAAPYVLELYATDATLIGKVPGFIDLPAGREVPLFVRSAAGGSTVARVFVNFEPEKILWEPAQAIQLPLKVENTSLVDGDASKLSATLVNEGYEAIHTVRVVAIIYDGQGTAIAASETLVPSVRAQSTIPITFTWNEPFSTRPVRYEILPTVPLP